MARLTASFSLDGKTTTAVPSRFFAELGRQGFIALMAPYRDGITTAQETRQIWRLLHRQDAPPKSVRLIIKTSEIMALYPRGAPGTGSIASALDALWADLVEN